ncbi:unnamed protein product [Anisakis simplex]|uniref:Arrestin C-terminal-like domain-containing protein n=1 Tax=Anisakis simplex TaxID=6269 RepID=A0A3P6PPN2_ANISI|nr:unnamed protein product [Anisakis simplex]
MNAELHLSKKGFIPGERIPVGILIENQSGKSVKHAHLSIVQLASCFATYPSPATRDCAFETSGVGLPIPKIPSGNTYKYAPEFYVPALVPDFEILGRLKVDHFLKLEIGFNRHQKSKHAICLIKIPILIGTSTAPERPPPPSDNDAWWTKVASDSAAGKSTEGGAEEASTYLQIF